MSDRIEQVSVVPLPDQDGLMIWATASDMSTLFVNGGHLPTALRALATEAETRNVDRFAVDLQMTVEDDDTITVGLLLEEVHWL